MTGTDKVGYDEGGQLTEAVRRSPYSVVLFDEIEKAHPDVFNILLQVLDDGRITDSHGRTVDFKNTIIIMTSNLGSDIILEGIEDGKITDGAKSGVNAILSRTFRPEFLNRLDEIIFFTPLSREHIGKIVKLSLRSLEERLAERRISVRVSDDAKKKIADEAYTPAFGARPLKRYLQSHIETLIAKRLIAENPAPESVVSVDVGDGGYTAEILPPENE